MKILHIVPGLNDPTNGIAVAAKLIAAEQQTDVIDTREFLSFNFNSQLELSSYDEVWVHSMWLPMTMRACWKVVREKEKVKRKSEKVGFEGPRLVRMPHGCMDPVKVQYHWHKKRWVAPIEKWLFSRCDRVVSTEVAEDGWIKDFIGKRCPPIERISLNHPTFDWAKLPPLESKSVIKNILYVGRLHPLKGVKYLIEAMSKGMRLVSIGKDEGEGAALKTLAAKLGVDVEFRGGVSEEAKAEAMCACDLFVLPTLSENYGLVVEEALMYGKRVVTTDGAPAWAPPEAEQSKPKSGVEQWRDRIIYLKGYRDGTDEERVRLLKEALEDLRSRSRGKV